MKCKVKTIFGQWVDGEVYGKKYIFLEGKHYLVTYTHTFYNILSHEYVTSTETELLHHSKVVIQ